MNDEDRFLGIFLPPADSWKVRGNKNTRNTLILKYLLGFSLQTYNQHLPSGICISFNGFVVMRAEVNNQTAHHSSNQEMIMPGRSQVNSQTNSFVSSGKRKWDVNDCLELAVGGETVSIFIFSLSVSLSCKGGTRKNYKIKTKPFLLRLLPWPLCRYFNRGQSSKRR